MSVDPTEEQGRKTAIVTGGASGLGFAIAEHFASLGHNVAVFDVNIDVGNEAVSKLLADHPQANVIFRKCDVSSWKNQVEAFKEVYTGYGKIDIVVANAGISEQGLSALASIENDEPQEPNLKVLDVDLSGVIYWSNISPNKSMYENMVITPISTLIKGVAKFIEDKSLNGELAEIHGQNVTLRPPHDFVDEDSRRNLENFWSLGWA